MFFLIVKLYKKILELTQLKFLGELFINESMCHKNHHFSYKCCQISAHKIYFKWFYNITLHIKLAEIKPLYKIFHSENIEKVLG